MATSKEVPGTSLEVEATYLKLTKDENALEANQTFLNVCIKKRRVQTMLKILELNVLARDKLTKRRELVVALLTLTKKYKEIPLGTTISKYLTKDVAHKVRTSEP